MSLLSTHTGLKWEAGCDEAGRGCLAGPVFAAAVILPLDFYHPDLDDSKKLGEIKKLELKKIIEKESVSYAVSKMDAPEIDTYNILWASVRTMHKALNKLTVKPEYIIVDGNKFLAYKKVPHDCIIKGDGIYASIAAASILAKTYRDEYMTRLHKKYPMYGWDCNKGYPTQMHRQAILEHGPCPFHRTSFRLFPLPKQGSLF